jgi:hypothetical protein
VLPIFAESYHDLKKTNKVLEDLLKAAPFFDKEIAPKGILEHIRAACNRVFVSGFAAEVEKVYTGMETVITKILKYTDKTVPEGQSSHQRLIEIASLNISGTRPALCSEKTSENLHKLRLFRHKIRHTYEIDLDSTIVKDMVVTSKNAYTGLVQDIIKFQKAIEPDVNPAHLKETTTGLLDHGREH